MKKASVAQQALSVLYGSMQVKRFIDGFTTVLLRLEALTTRRTVIRRLRRHRIAIVLSALTVILGFEVAVALQFVSGRHVLPLEFILWGSVFSLLLLGCVKMLPTVGQINLLRELNASDLLEREVVPLQTTSAHAILKGQIILVTGAAGSIGSELCRQLLDCQPQSVIAMDTNETGLFDLAESLRSHPYAAHFCPCISDITDGQRMSHLFAEEQPNIIFHAAAYKHVPLLEQFPDQAVRTNILATFHLCRLAQKHNVARFVFISSDKAAEPTGVMGASKRIGEMIIQSLARSSAGETCFCAVRFGNVIGSRGSVVPVFTQQIEQGGPITVTDPDATRYFMTIPEACGLVVLTAAISAQGGLYLLDMGRPVRIMDLAIRMTRLCGLRIGRDIPIVYTGLRPGERLHETLVAADEELVSTTHDRILSITHRDNLPTFTTLAQWMHCLDDNLQRNSSAQLREQLFKIAREQELVVNS